uniref:Anterior gradient 2 n=1 Tax=Scleropages formosus TaxID=113540 RepID=A0A8C9SKZ4_SCLFO
MRLELLFRDQHYLPRLGVLLTTVRIIPTLLSKSHVPLRSAPSPGWGDELIWAQTYEEALYRAKSSTKFLMVIFHLENCPHSSALKKAFAENKKIQKMADEDFILLNLVFETTDKHLSPDGQYVPRILFLASPSLRLADPSLTVRADITGRYADRLYAYEPSDVGLRDNMKKAKKLLKTEL